MSSHGDYEIRTASWSVGSAAHRAFLSGPLDGSNPLTSTTRFAETDSFYASVKAAHHVNVLRHHGDWWVTEPAGADMEFFGVHASDEPTAFVELTEPIWELPYFLPQWGSIDEATALTIGWQIATGSARPPSAMCAIPN